MSAWPFTSRRRVSILEARLDILTRRFDAMDKCAAIMAAADTPREAVIAELRRPRHARPRHGLRVVR